MDADSLVERWRPMVPALATWWKWAAPFPFIVIDDFLPPDLADGLLEHFPVLDTPGWDATTYVHQKKKLTLTEKFPEPISEFFKLTASEPFRDFISAVTGIPKILDDPELVGGGCHQIVRDGFLDVHVDFNFHPTTGLHRRLNLLMYLNKDWDSEWGGCLELWDMTGKQKVHDVSPIFNRAVLFETSEVSYHGHPTPLNSPADVTRKSLAVYYYTVDRDDGSAVKHNTLYRQTTGTRGLVKTASSGFSAIRERISSQGGVGVVREIERKVARKFRGLPPENR